MHVPIVTNIEATYQTAIAADQSKVIPSDAYILEFDDDTQEDLSNGLSTDVPPPPPPNETVEPEAADLEVPRIPISHLITNQYPSLTNVPQDIAKSYAPIYVQPQNQQSTTDIYNDYVNNPYNLVLQVDTPAASNSTNENTPVAIPITSHFAAVGGGSTISNVFHASNYFAEKSAAIPPGSEILFNGP